jgi:hypothetical protein
MYTVTLRRLPITIVAVESNKYYIFWLCFCSFSYPPCNANDPYCHLWPARLYGIFTHSNKRQGVGRSVWPVLIDEAGKQTPCIRYHVSTSSLHFVTMCYCYFTLIMIAERSPSHNHETHSRSCSAHWLMLVAQFQFRDQAVAVGRVGTWPKLAGNIALLFGTLLYESSCHYISLSWMTVANIMKPTCNWMFTANSYQTGLISTLPPHTY